MKTKQQNKQPSPQILSPYNNQLTKFLNYTSRKPQLHKQHKMQTKNRDNRKHLPKNEETATPC